MQVLFDRLPFLLALLFPGVEGEDPEQDLNPPEPEPEADEPDPDADRDLDPEPEDDNDSEDPPEPRARASSRDLEDLRATTRRLEQELEESRNARRQPAGPTDEQRRWDAEQRIIDDPTSTAQDKHAAHTNRALRESHALSMSAHQRAEDLADKAEYNLKAMDNPVFRKMADRVEKERQRIAALGRGMPNREVCLAVLLGQDLIKGKITPATSKSKVARPGTQRVRSDVTARSGRSESDKRRARLENQLI